MQTAIASPMISALETAWAGIQIHHPEVPSVYLILGSGVEERRNRVMGSFAPERWNPRGPTPPIDALNRPVRLSEVFLAGETIQAGVEEVLGTLLHEAAHALCRARAQADTSRAGRYHNGKFQAAAEELLLTCTKGKQGWDQTALTEGARERYRMEMSVLDHALSFYRGAGAKDEDEKKDKKPATSRVALTCSCEPEPRRVLIVPAQALEGMITCGKCHDSFVDRTGKLAEWWLEQQEAGTTLEPGEDVDLELLLGKLEEDREGEPC